MGKRGKPDNFRIPFGRTASLASPSIDSIIANDNIMGNPYRVESEEYILELKRIARRIVSGNYLAANEPCYSSTDIKADLSRYNYDERGNHMSRHPRK